MKIIMKTQVSSGNSVYNAGEIVDIELDKAEEFIRKGYAASVENKTVEVNLSSDVHPPKIESQKDTIVPKKKTGKR